MFRPWPTWAELEEEGQHSRPMPMLHLDFLWHIETSSGCRLSFIKSWSRESLLSSRGTGPLMRDSVSPGVKLAVTLRHLITGDSYTTLQYAFRVASPTIEEFLSEGCDAITRAYRDQVMQCPTLPEDWLPVESVFRQRWIFPHSLGAPDGRHIPMRCPQGGGNLFHNCKSFHSIVLLVLVD